jgi:acetyl-CoA carboxylase alpha subunit
VVGGYRKAQRAFTLAERFSPPVVTLVDLPGAATDVEAEAGGLARSKQGLLRSGLAC